MSSRRWAHEVRNYCPQVPIILCGNMSDLRTNERAMAEYVAKGFELVPFEDAQALGKEIGAEMVLECSAQTGEGLQAVYRHAIEVALRGRATRGIGYIRTSRRIKTCKACGQPSKATCECKRRIREVPIAEMWSVLAALTPTNNMLTYAHSYMRSHACRRRCGNGAEFSGRLRGF